MFAVYRKLFSLHQMLWYLGEALLQKETASFHGELQMLIQTLDTVRRQPWKTVLTADIDSLHEQTNRLLKKDDAAKAASASLILISIQLGKRFNQ